MAQELLSGDWGQRVTEETINQVRQTNWIPTHVRASDNVVRVPHLCGGLEAAVDQALHRAIRALPDDAPIPALEDVRVERREDRRGHDLVFCFTGGHSILVFVNDADVEWRHDALSREHARGFLMVCHRRWVDLVERHQVERQERRLREPLEEAYRIGAPPETIRQLHQMVERQIHELRMARSHPQMVVDDGYLLALDRDDICMTPGAVTMMHPMTATEVAYRQGEMLAHAQWRTDDMLGPLVDATLRMVGLEPGDFKRVSSDAEKRAQQLLVENLTPQQRGEYVSRRRFTVVGSQTKRRYVITHGHAFNVQEVDQRGRHVRRLCFTPAGNLAMGDVMLAQKIALECDESSALAVANFMSY